VKERDDGCVGQKRVALIDGKKVFAARRRFLLGGQANAHVIENNYNEKCQSHLRGSGGRHFQDQSTPLKLIPPGGWVPRVTWGGVKNGTPWKAETVPRNSMGKEARGGLAPIRRPCEGRLFSPTVFMATTTEETWVRQCEGKR